MEAGGKLGISEITVKAPRGQFTQKMKANSLADPSENGCQARARASRNSIGVMRYARLRPGERNDFQSGMLIVHRCLYVSMTHCPHDGSQIPGVGHAGNAADAITKGSK
jgi:hypothetical protein